MSLFLLSSHLFSDIDCQKAYKNEVIVVNKSVFSIENKAKVENPIKWFQPLDFRS